MPVFESSQLIARPIEEVFAFFRAPANLVMLSPGELHLRVVEGPVLIELGSRLVLKGRRWGIPQRMVSEITAFEVPFTFTDTQIEGPLRRWVHAHRFGSVAGGTQISDRIEYEPPGGMLGFMVTASRLERDLRWIFEYRSQKLIELFGE
jgi:ligand-binding SRPBCC domain-containing protein